MNPLTQTRMPVYLYDFDAIEEKLDAFNLIDSAVGVIDPDFHVVFQNNAFRKLNANLRVNAGKFYLTNSLLECREIIDAIQYVLTTRKVHIIKHRLYYSEYAYVDVSVCLKPILNKEINDLVYGVMFTIGEESIDYESKYLARLQDDLARVKDRIIIQDNERINNDQFINALFQDSPLAMILFNKDQTIIRMNKMAEKLFCTKSHEAIGQSCRNIMDCYKNSNCCPVAGSDASHMPLGEVVAYCSKGNKKHLLRSAVSVQGLDADGILEIFINKKDIEC
jgi:PAS domain S-box-containing protein